MRKSKRQIPESKALSIVENGEYGVLSIVGPSVNDPYGVPLNYCLIDNTIYFHCAAEGQKIDFMKANPNVSFCVVGKTRVKPEKFTTTFESTIVQGIASEVFENEKQLALEGLIKKYACQFIESGNSYIKRVGPETTVYKISIKLITGKASR